MKLSKTLLAIGMAIGLSPLAASALTILDISPYAPPFDPVTAGQGDVETWLATLVNNYNNPATPAGPLAPLPAPGLTLVSVGPGAIVGSFPQFGAGTTTITLPLSGYNYVTLRWGGPQIADNWQAFYIGGDTTFTFNSPSGQYGLSDYRFFGERTPGTGVPDAASTLSLLGIAMTGFGVGRRFIKK